jgi:hypothetical protein
MMRRCKMKIRKTIYWIVGIVVLLGWTDLVWGQTYTVGDIVDNFGAEACVNGEGYWDYDTDGLNKIVWLNLFTSW